MNILNIMRFIGEKNPKYAVEEKDDLMKMPHEISYRNSNGKKEGEWTYYYYNGGTHSTGHFNNGKKNGEWKFYYRSGQLKSIINYRDDKVIDEVHYWESGKKRDL